MQPGVAIDAKAQVDFFPFAKAEAAIVVVFFQVEVVGALKGERGDVCRQDAVQRQISFVVVAAVAAHEVEAWALLDEAQGHDVHLVALAAGVAVVER